MAPSIFPWRQFTYPPIQEYAERMNEVVRQHRSGQLQASSLRREIQLNENQREANQSQRRHYLEELDRLDAEDIALDIRLLQVEDQLARVVAVDDFFTGRPIPTSGR